MNTEKILEKILVKIENMDNKIVDLDNKIVNLDNRINHIDEKVNSMDDKINSMDDKINSMDERIGNMDERIGNIEGQLNENTSILRALEHASEVHRAELDKLNIQVAKLSGNEEKIEKLEDNLENHNHNIIIQSNKANVS